MPQDDTDSSAKARKSSVPKGSSRHGQQTWFKTPPSIKRLFDRFPVCTYPVNELPERTAPARAQHALYIFTTVEGARHGAPSFNPGCLKWQVRSHTCNWIQSENKEQWTDNSKGIPQILRPPLHHYPFKQPRLTYGRSPLPNSSSAKLSINHRPNTSHTINQAPALDSLSISRNRLLALI